MFMFMFIFMFTWIFHVHVHVHVHVQVHLHSGKPNLFNAVPIIASCSFMILIKFISDFHIVCKDQSRLCPSSISSSLIFPHYLQSSHSCSLDGHQGPQSLWDSRGVRESRSPGVPECRSLKVWECRSAGVPKPWIVTLPWTFPEIQCIVYLLSFSSPRVFKWVFNLSLWNEE